MTKSIVFNLPVSKISNDELLQRMDVRFYHPKYNIIDKILSNTSFDVCALEEISHVSRISGFEIDEHKIAKYTDDGIPYLRIQNIDDFEIHLDGVKKIPLDVHKKLLNSQLIPGDIAFNTTGKVGNAAVIPTTLKEANASNQIARIRTGPKVIPDYLAFFLNSVFGKSQTEKWQSGSTRPRTLIQNLRKLSIVVPTLKIQQDIVKKLLKLKTDLIEHRKKLESERVLVHEKIRQTYQHVYDLLGIVSNNVRKNVFLITPDPLNNRIDVNYFLNKNNFSIKSPFIQYKISDLVDFSHEKYVIKDTQSSIINYIEISNVDSYDAIIDSYSEILDKDASSRAKQIIHEGDVIVAMSGIDRDSKRLATALVSKEYDNFVASTGFGVLKTKDDVLPKFLYYLLRSDYIISQIKSRLTGAILPSIRKIDFMCIQTVKPSIKIQKQIIKLLDVHVDTSHKIKNELDQLYDKQQSVSHYTDNELEKILIS